MELVEDSRSLPLFGAGACAKTHKCERLFPRNFNVRACQIIDNPVDTMIDRLTLCVQREVRIRGRVIGRPDTREVRNFPAAGTSIESFGVALFADVERRVDKDFDERRFANDVPGIFPVLWMRRNGCRDGDEPFFAKKRGHVSDAAKAFRTLSFAIAQVGIEAGAQHIAVEYRCAKGSRLQPIL